MEPKRLINNKARYPGTFDKNVIIVNAIKSKRPFKGVEKQDQSVINSILHEETHSNHPQMHEEQVYKRARQLVKELSKKQEQKIASKYKKV